MKRPIIFIFLFLISLSFVTPTESWKYNYLDQGQEVQFGGNYSINVNSTEKWVTSEGILDNVGDILHNWLDNLEWSNSGHTIDTDIDMNGNALTNVDSIYLDLTPTSTGSEGEIWWSEEDGTLNIGLHNGSVLQTGQEFLFYAKASGTITNGDVIQFVGVQGDHILVKKAVGSEIEANPEYFLGIATQDIANGGFGYITSLGEVRDFDTDTFQLGDILYFDFDTGQLTNSTPTPPNRIISIAVVTKVETSAPANNGVILVRPTVGLSMDDLSDVNNGCPDLYILQKNATSGTWECTSLATTYYNATSSQAVTGTVAGTLSLTQHSDGDYDGVTFNITERVTSPALDLRVNFTDGITTFTQSIIRYYTGTINGDHPMIQLWDYEDEVWENYGELSESTSFAILEQSVFDSSEHVQNGTVQMRIYKSTTGNINNKYYVDWFAVAKGFGVPAGEEIDPIFSDWKNLINTTQFDNIENLHINETYIGSLTDLSAYVPYTGATSNVDLGGNNLTVGETNGDAGNIYVHLGDEGSGEYNTRISGGELYMEAEGSTLTINPFSTDGYFNNHFTFFGENYAGIGTYNTLTLTGSPIKLVGNLQQLSDSNKIYFGAGNDASIGYDGTNLIFNTSLVGNGIAYFSDNVSAQGFIDRTYITNTTDKEAYELLQYVEENFYVNGTKNHSAWGECYVPINVTDKSRPEIEYYEAEVYNKTTKTYENITLNRTIYPYTTTDDGVDMGCKQVITQKAQNYMSSAGSPVTLQDGTVALDGDTSLWENIYTKSKVISLMENYALKFLNTTNLDSKDTHKNKETLNLSDGSNITTLGLEPRVVDLEGAFSDHMTCMYLHTKYEDYRDCMLDTNPKEKIK